MDKILRRNIQIDIALDKYKCASMYSIPEDIEEWLQCPKCNLRPLIWEFNNGRSTACGCNNFSIHSESVMSVMYRCNGSASEYDIYALRNNWNIWVKTGGELETLEYLKNLNRW